MMMPIVVVATAAMVVSIGAMVVTVCILGIKCRLVMVMPILTAHIF